MSFLHGLPPADSACGGVEVDPNLHELPPVGGVRHQVSLAVDLLQRVFRRAVHLQLEYVDVCPGLQDDVSPADCAPHLALDVQPHHGEQKVEDGVVMLLRLVFQVIRDGREKRCDTAHAAVEVSGAQVLGEIIYK